MRTNTSTTTDKLDAPTPGPIAPGDHVSWVPLKASYQDGRDPTPPACGEVTSLMHSGDGRGLLAHTTVHDRLHRPTPAVEAVPVRRLRREPSVTRPTTEVGIVREAMGGISGWAAIVREATGGMILPQPTVHAKTQETTPMSSSTQTTAQESDMTQGNPGAQGGFAPGDHASWRLHGDTAFLLGGDPLLQSSTLGQRGYGEIVSFGADGIGPVAYVNEHDSLHHQTGAQSCFRLNELRREKPLNSSTMFVSGHPAPDREGQGMTPYDTPLASVREAAGDLAPEEPLGTARAYGLFLGNLQSGRR